MSVVDRGCPFCQIVALDALDALDAREVYRDELVIAFFPTDPAVLGHTMVVPRQHVETIWDLQESLAERLATVTVRIARVVRDTLRPDGLNIIQSNGSAATQTVMHLHIHVVPRWEGDSIGPIWPPESDYSEEQKDTVWDALRKACGALTRGGAGATVEQHRQNS